MIMNENQPIFTVTNFKFGIFDSVPKPDSDKAYILFKEGGNIENILVITEQKPVLGGQIKAGGYNKMMEVSLEEKKFEFKKEIADETNNFRFYITVQLKYHISDPVYIFKKRINTVVEKIQEIILKVIEEEHKKYDIESQIELENDLRSRIVKHLQEILYIETRELSVGVDLDERAQRIIDSNLDVMAMGVVERNEREKLSQEIEGKKKIEIQQLEGSKEVEKIKNDLIFEKAKGMKALEEKLGEDYSTFLAYVNGEINSVEFDEKMHQNKSSAMFTKLELFKQLVDMDVLSGPALERAAVKLIGSDIAVDTNDDVESEDVVVEETEVL